MEFSTRERQLIWLAGAILGPLIFFRLVLFPFLDYKSSLSEGIEKRQREILTIQKKGEEFLYYNSRMGGSHGAPMQRSSRILGQLGLREQASMSSRPGDEGIAIQLDELTLAEVTSLIYRLESSRPPLNVKGLEIKPSLRNKDRLNLQLTLEGR